MVKEQQMDVIWNLTQECPWDCAICCVSAKPIGSQQQSGELDFKQKMAILKQLAEGKFEVDFSGGDPLFREEDLLIVEEATRIFPKEAIGISTTGARMNQRKLEVCRAVSIVEFTLDTVPGVANSARPRGYAQSSARAMRQLIDVGVKTRGVTPLFPLTMRKENLEAVYAFLCEIGCPEWELLRFYPVGRGKKFLEKIPTDNEYLWVMEFVENFRGLTQVFFQHSLDLLRGKGQCPAVWKSLGILPNGVVTACSWSINDRMNPMSGMFYLGRVPDEDLADIIARAREKPEFRQQVDYCRTLDFIDKNE